MAITPDIYQLKISLNHIKPAIWRSFQVRSDVKLAKLHEIIQIVMGWENYHLYSFHAGGSTYTDRASVEDDMYGMGYRDGLKVKLSEVLSDVGGNIIYRYDFGDDWEHTLKLEKIFAPLPGEKYPVCIDGARACPPEDCGGIPGYEDLLRVLADPNDEEHEEMKSWVGPHFNPENFDPEIVNIGLPRRVVGGAGGDAARTGAKKKARAHPEPSAEPRTYITNMMHFLNEDGLVPMGQPEEFYAMLNYFGDIVNAASSHPTDAQFCSTVVCRGESGRRRCGSYLTIAHQPGNTIHWQCSECGDQGFISSWLGTIYDLNEAVERDPTQRVSVAITPDEHRLLKEAITSSQEEDAIISGAVSTPDGVILSGGLDDFDLLLGSIAFNANHAKTAKCQKTMDKVYEKIASVVEG